jgi:hypothetical protein
LKRLADPFDPAAIEWRVGQVTKDGRRCYLLAYLTARHVMTRLDNVVGAENWQDDYQQGPDGGIMCRIGVRVTGGEWVWKTDGAENTAVEAVKGGYSGAFKRAAVKWGIGRYLYDLDTVWQQVEEGWANGRGVDVSAKGKGHLGWVPTPTLPTWALPGATLDELEALLDERGRGIGAATGWCLSLGKAAPGAMTPQQLRGLVDYLTGAGWHKFEAWCEDNVGGTK